MTWRGAWTACRNEAKAAGKDYIDECQDHFKSFLQCALDHRDYYEPFLEMLGGLTDEEEGREEAEAEEAKREKVQVEAGAEAGPGPGAPAEPAKPVR
ncbi:hypothetical protein GPECTOR_62g921 [Gonium pectorale]|uniref:GCK domain-containing protein n=1 Tax=Gonium pectorale TaxID=33097 RepID=A0A150G4J8_GONPE|nr:hypothetical protein GPECTOR_62g921 [Gonium pectorale]|eukprot:KXZ44806.1 hypothetical protein GPECTOR_62g921 [Gonium pectorale]